MEYVRPRSLAEAVATLAESDGDGRPIAGGQSLVPLLNLGLAMPSVLVDVSDLNELRGITVTEDEVVIGAATTHAEVACSSSLRQQAPLLPAAAAHIGSVRIRNRGTIGGSLAHADPAAEFPTACWVLEAVYVAVGPHGTRRIPAEDFSCGHYLTALGEDEILTEIRIPRRQLGWGFHEQSRRAGDFALAAVAAVASVRNGVVSDCRVAVAAARDRPQRLSTLEGSVNGTAPEEVAGSFPAELVEVAPHEDAYVPAAYRRRLIAVLARRAVLDAVARAGERPL